MSSEIKLNEKTDNKKNFTQIVTNKIVTPLTVAKNILQADDSRLILFRNPSTNSFLEALKNKNKYRPAEQISLSEDELKEIYTRVLTVQGDFVKRNLVIFSYKNKKFINKVEEDRSHIIFELEGIFLRKGSIDANEYLQHSKDVAKIKASKNKFNQMYIDEYIDKNGEISYRLLKNSFNFFDRSIMTFNKPKRDSGMNTDNIVKVSFSDTASASVIFEAYQIDNKLKLLSTKKLSKLKPKPAVMTKPLIMDFNTRLINSAIIIERMLLQNFYDDEILDYKYYEDAADEQMRPECKGSLLPLWKFSCSLTDNKCITSICWHAKYKDLFAVSIGSYNYGDRKTRGFILIYNLIDPNNYHNKFEYDSGCMSLDFHQDYSYLLLAGFYDGSVMIYDLRVGNKSKPDHFEFDKNAHRHTEPVWYVKWQKNTVDNHRTFYSISSDGTVINWILKYNILFSQVTVKLKHVDMDTEIFEDQPLNAGTCFDFNTKPDDIFIVGTENGQIYEYSTHYSSILHTVFEAHTMPVYAIKWNNFHKKVFISCSADWHVLIWDHRVKNPIYTYDLGEPVADIDWAPYSSTVFALVTISGLVNVYDLSVDSNNPLCSQNILTKKKRQLTHLKFNPKTPILLVSDNRGSVYSLKLSPNLRLPPNDDKRHKIAVINKENFEISKLAGIINNRMNEDGYEKARSTRKVFNYVEVKVKKNDDLEDQKDEDSLNLV